MNEKRFEAKGPDSSGTWVIFDNEYDSTRSLFFTASYPGGPQTAAEAEAARLNAWCEAEQAKKPWRASNLYPHWIDDSSGLMRVVCYDSRGNDSPSLAARILRLLNEDEARTK